jgi:hypothetical protein
MTTPAAKFLVLHNGEQQGPFPISKIQRMIRDEGLPPDVFIWRAGMEEWQPANTIAVTLATIAQKEALHYLGKPTPRGFSCEEAKIELDAASEIPEKKEALNRWTNLVAKRTEFLQYCTATEKRCPLSPFDLEMHLEGLQEQMGEGFEALEPYELYRILDNYRQPRGWEADPISDAQKRLLLSKHIPVSSDMTKGEASDLIGQILDGATEGQIRRLNFYGIDPDHVTKKEACILIDDYIAKNPDSENDYQRWKMSLERQPIAAGVVSRSPSIPSGKGSGALVVAIIAAAAAVAALLFVLLR